MRQINRNRLSRRCLLWATAFALLLPLRGIATVHTLDRGTWKRYTQAQKELAIAGFVHCYRAATSLKDAFARKDVAAVIRIVNGPEKGEGTTFGSLILQALKDAPGTKPDVHAEHWSAPYGFASGLWWRGLEDLDRKAYVQGVFWCAETAPTIAVTVRGQSVARAVCRLNKWYVVSDDDWKNPLSNARVDVPVIVAMKQMEIISVSK